MKIEWRLVYIMLEKDIKTGELAKKTNLTTTTIARLKNIKTMPRRLDSETLVKLCDALECQPGELMRFVKDDTVDIKP